ncbi:lantibiotic dehydratase [Myceligenerans halotolerans]
MSEFPVVARIPLLPVESESRDLAGALTGPLAEAVRFASRSVGRVAAGDVEVDARLAGTLRAYELRARTRATPRGAFAGVQVARPSDGSARLRLGPAHRARSAPSGAWLDDVADRLIGDPTVLAGLRFSANSLVSRRGDRFVNERTTGADKPSRVTMRATAAVSLILETCRRDAMLDQIVAAVIDAWAQAPEQMVRSTVVEMVRTGLLLTDLLPDHIADDPLGHVLSKLPDGEDLVEPLTMISKHLRAADRHPPGAAERIEALSTARDLCDAITRHETPITVDVVADADLQVPASLLSEAAEVAGLLWSITPTGTALDSYHARFVDRYGTDRRVPLEHVVGPVVGLGDPDEDVSNKSRAEESGASEAVSRRRARVLAGLIASADGDVQVTLDDDAVAGLRVRADGVPPSRTGEIYAQVIAASRQDAEHGRYQLAAYLGCTQDAGSSVGRFASLLGGFEGSLQAPSGQAVTAEVVVRPRASYLATVAPPSGFASPRICVGVAPRPGDLTLDDLELASDGYRLVLWSRSRDQEVVPTLFSRIGPSHIPPVARLLADLAQSGTRPWHPWTWGPLDDAPFLPRVRWRRTILSPAQWRLPHSLVTASDDAAAFAAELGRWRTTTTPRPPSVVLAEDSDRRLPLDLDDERDRDLLRRYVRRGTDTVTEPPGGPAAVQGVVAGADGGHALELVIPLRGQQPKLEPHGRPRPVTNPVVHLPGSEWLSLTLPAPPAHHDDLLTHLSDMAEQVRDDIAGWFWLRYANNAHGPHLRIRFHGEPDALNGRVLPAISQRCAILMAQGAVGPVVVEPYEPEIDRYGGPDAIMWVEHVFHADSTLVPAVLATRPGQDGRLMLIALSAVEIAQTVADGDPAALSGPRLDKPARRRVNALRTSTPQRPSELLDGAASDAWARRGGALTVYRTAVPASRRADCASSLIHMHANRMGASRDDERLARALAVQILAKEAR